jgi:cell shape-determining protein MreC
MSLIAWVPILAAAVMAASAVWTAWINRRGQTDVSAARAETDFRNSLLKRLASVEERVAELQNELIKEREKSLDKQREYLELQLKYDVLKAEVEELRPLRDEVEHLRLKLEEYEGKGRRK